MNPAPGHTAAVANAEQISYAVASVTRAEPCKWEGEKAHFVRLHVEFHPDATHYMERVDFTIRVWKAGDAFKSIESISHTKLLTFEPPKAPEYGNEAPPIVFYSPRAVVGRSTGSKAEPYWEGHFQSGEHFVYFAEAMPPVDIISAGPHASTQPRSLLHISSFGDDKEWRPAPNFDVVLVVLSQGKPFDLTASSTSLHWGIPAAQRYLFTPYKPARFTRTTRLIPKGEKRISMDLADVTSREFLKRMMGWGSIYDTIWFGCPDGCVDKPDTPGRHCSSESCKTSQDSRRMYEERCDAEASASPTS